MSSEQEPKEELPKSLSEAKEEIRKMLTEAWKLPEGERKKVIRRLYLRWHPDKNPNYSDLCNEAFKYLLNQILNLERTGHVRNEDEGFSNQSSSQYHSSNGFRRDHSSFYEDFFRQWNSEAR